MTAEAVRVEFGKESLTFTAEDAPMATLLLSIMGSAGLRAVTGLCGRRRAGGLRWAAAL